MAIDGRKEFFTDNLDISFSGTPSWDRQVAMELARMIEIWPLSGDHWKVVDFVRDYYLKYTYGPSVYKISRGTGFRLQHLFELFPCKNGIRWGAYLIAGLPFPCGKDDSEPNGQVLSKPR